MVGCHVGLTKLRIKKRKITLSPEEREERKLAGKRQT
jgi:hypothetical protein